MFGISFVISTDGKNDYNLSQVIDSIEFLNIPNYEIILVGGNSSTVKRKNLFHLSFDETLRPLPWVTAKKNDGVRASRYEICVVMNDYFLFDPTWYEEFVKFGIDWDLCVQQQFVAEECGGYRYNGWRCFEIPQYPEIPFNLALPWDIDCFIPYMAIHGAFWVVKRDKMIEVPLDESRTWGQREDIEWSSRIVPGWLGHNIHRTGFKIVANPKCITRLNKIKRVGPCGPDNQQILDSLEWLWEDIRAGNIRPGTVYYDSTTNKIKCV